MTKSTTHDFTGSTVLVTGGGTGIGLAIARDFAAAGANVVISGRRSGVLDEVVGNDPTGRIVGITTDVAQPGDVRKLVGAAVDQFSSLDVVVSNAAAYAPGDIVDLSDDDWNSMRATNVDALFHLAKAALPHLQASGGNLIATSSVSGLGGDWGQAGYNATKGAVSNFVRSLALDWGTRGVRVNAVAPAVTDTSAVAMITEDPELRATFEHRTALGRLGQPEDISAAVLWLASDAARYVTGVVLPVDGGTSASSGQAHP